MTLNVTVDNRKCDITLIHYWHKITLFDNRFYLLKVVGSNVTSTLFSCIFYLHFSPRIASDSVLNRNFSRADYLSPMMQKPSLLKKGSVMMVASPSSYGSSQAECWKSETFLLILKEIFLNQNSMDHQQNVLDLPIVSIFSFKSLIIVIIIRILCLLVILAQTVLATFCQEKKHPKSSMANL